MMDLAEITGNVTGRHRVYFLLDGRTDSYVISANNVLLFHMVENSNKHMPCFGEQPWHWIWYSLQKFRLGRFRIFCKWIRVLLYLCTHSFCERYKYLGKWFVSLCILPKKFFTHSFYFFPGIFYALETTKTDTAPREESFEGDMFVNTKKLSYDWQSKEGKLSTNAFLEGTFRTRVTSTRGTISQFTVPFFCFKVLPSLSSDSHVNSDHFSPHGKRHDS